VRFSRFYVIPARLQKITNRLQKVNPNITMPRFVFPVVFSFSLENLFASKFYPLLFQSVLALEKMPLLTKCNPFVKNVCAYVCTAELAELSAANTDNLSHTNYQSIGSRIKFDKY